MTRSGKRKMWGLLGIVTLIVLRLSDGHPDLIENVYGNGVYPVVRTFFSVVTGWMPFPAIHVMAVLLIVLAYNTVYIPWKRNTWTLWTFISGGLSTCGAIIFLFYMLWGFNYRRESITSRMSLEAIPLDSVALAAEFRSATVDLVQWATMHELEIRENMLELDGGMEDSLISELLPVLMEANFPITKTPRGRLIKPKGILLRFSTAGIYIPFTGEGHVDAGMLPIQIPYTMSHELAHGYGVTNEGECNFLAYLACSRSKDPVIKFSALLGYWRYVAFDFRRHFRSEYTKAYAALPDLIRDSMDAIHLNNQKYPDIMPEVRNAVYDSYLRSNGIEDGLVSYNRVVRMVHAYRMR